MIQVEHIIDGNKSLLTIVFNRRVLEHLNAKCDDYLNFYQSAYKINYFTLFKADTGYRITRSKQKKFYEIIVRHPIRDIQELELTSCTYYLKKNGFIKFIVRN